MAHLHKAGMSILLMYLSLVNWLVNAWGLMRLVAQDTWRILLIIPIGIQIIYIKKVVHINLLMLIRIQEYVMRSPSKGPITYRKQLRSFHWINCKRCGPSSLKNILLDRDRSLWHVYWLQVWQHCDFRIILGRRWWEHQSFHEQNIQWLTNGSCSTPWSYQSSTQSTIKPKAEG